MPTPVKLIPRLKPCFDHKELLAALIPTSGNIEKFENEFAGRFECSYGIMFSHGRSGLYALLKIWGLNDAEVVVPAYTCVVVPHAVVLSGNAPAFVDCAKGSFNMDLDGVRKAITPKTRVVIPTHLFGYPMDVKAIEVIVQEAEEKYGHKIFVVQDCAHSFGAKWDGDLVTKYGDAALFGLNISKTTSSIFGGMIITNNKQVADELRSFRDGNFKQRGFEKTIKRFLYLLSTYATFNPYVYYWVNKLERHGLIDHFVKYYDESEIKFPSDWDEMPKEIEARVGLANLEKYDQIIARRTDNARRYFSGLRDRIGMKLPPNDTGATFSHFVVLVENKDRLLKECLKRGIQLGWLIEYSIPEMTAYGAHSPAEFPTSANYTRSTINLPVWDSGNCARKVIQSIQ
jgi:dTDP-4-amino-4,6-dideoxygalactose transaminase